ncbi:MAG: serine hydrolase domain-containing protein [Pseudomonadota bacterium]
MCRRCVIYAFCAICLNILLSTANAAPEQTNDFSLLLEEAVPNNHAVGMAVAVVRSGTVERIATYGKRRVDGEEPIDPDTVFRIASLSKTMTASVISQMVSEEKVVLSLPVSAFAPRLRLKSTRATNALTLEHILSHRTSLPPNAYDNLLEAGISPSKIRARFSEVNPICSVGVCYAYQNIMFDAASLLIEQRDGKAFADALADRLFEPLGMERASVGLSNLKIDNNWARPHRRDSDKSWYVATVKDAYYKVPAAGGVNASISDMAEWLKAQLGHRPSVLSTNMLTLLHTPRVRTLAETRRVRPSMPNLEDAHYGLGWRIYTYNGETIISHFGSVDRGYYAQITFLPDRDVGIVLLINGGTKEFSKILPAFLDQEIKAQKSLTASGDSAY